MKRLLLMLYAVATLVVAQPVEAPLPEFVVVTKERMERWVVEYGTMQDAVDNAGTVIREQGRRIIYLEQRKDCA